MNPFALFGLQRWLIYGALAISIGTTLVGYGFYLGSKRLWEYQAEEAVKAVAIVKRIEVLKETVRVPYLKREVLTNTVFVEIEKEVVRVPSRPNCNVTLGWLRLHNAAAGGAGRPEGAVDDTTDTGIAEAGAAEAVTANYRSFHQVANDLRACRAFVDALPNAF